MAEFVPTQLNAEEQDEHNPPSPGAILLFQKSLIEKFGYNYFQTKPSEQLRGMHPKLQPSDFLPKFPSLRSLKAEIQCSVGTGVTISGKAASKQESIFLTINPVSLGPNLDLKGLAHQYCGQTVYVDYPYLRGAKVTSVSNGRVEWGYEKDNDSKSRGTVFNSNLKRTVIPSEKIRQWERKVQKIEDHYLSTLGIKIGQTEFLLCVTPIVGEKNVCIQSNQMIREKQFCPYPYMVPLQLVVEDLRLNLRSREKSATAIVFPPGSFCFKLGSKNYGLLGKVLNPISGEKGKVRVEWESKDTTEHEERKQNVIKDQRFVKVFTKI